MAHPLTNFMMLSSYCSYGFRGFGFFGGVVCWVFLFGGFFGWFLFVLGVQLERVWFDSFHYIVLTLALLSKAVLLEFVVRQDHHKNDNGPSIVNGTFTTFGADLKYS